MPPRIFDMAGVERDWAWLRGRYGNVRLLDAGMSPRFSLTEIHVTRGPATLRVVVRGAGGAPQGFQPVANAWPDPQPGGCVRDLRDGGLRRLWADVACVGRTDAAGIADFGLGPGSYIRDLTAGGPHTIWVCSPSTDSDGIAGLGMLGGTEHEGPLSLVFDLVTVAPPAPEPEPDPSAGSDVAAALARLEATLHGDLRALAAALAPAAGRGAVRAPRK